MSRVLQAIDQGLFMGCDTDLSTVCASDRFGEMMDERRSLSGRYGLETDQGVALRAGVLQMSTLLATMSEEDALQVARESQSGTPAVSDELLVLTQVLGECLILAARDCLPPHVLEWAKEWKRSSAEKQIAIAERLYHEFISQDQRVARSHSFETMREREEWRRRVNSHDLVKIMPRKYGMWCKQPRHLANCMGKSQMLLAFADLAGAESMAVSPIISINTLRTRWAADVLKKVCADLAERPYLYLPADFRESLAAGALSLALDGVEHTFHGCVALQLADGRWIMIDSHGLDWGVFPESWGMPGIYSTLQKYSEVLPGLLMMGSDEETPQRISAEEMVKVEALLQRSRDLEKRLGIPESWPPLQTLVDEFIDSEEIRILFPDQLFSQDLEEGRVLQNALMYQVLLGESAQDLMPGELMHRIVDLAYDPEKMKKRTGSLLTVYHAFAMDGFRNQRTDAGDLLHPVCEFHLPAMAIGYDAINLILLLEHDLATRRFALNHHTSQLALYSAMLHDTVPSDDEGSLLVRTAAEALQKMPHRHQLVERRLSMLTKEGRLG